MGRAFVAAFCERDFAPGLSLSRSQTAATRCLSHVVVSAGRVRFQYRGITRRDELFVAAFCERDFAPGLKLSRSQTAATR